MFISDKTDLPFLANELELSKEETIRFANKIIKKIHKSRSKKSMNVFEKWLKKKATKEGTVTETVTDSKENITIYKVDISHDSLITKTLAVVGCASIGVLLGKSVQTVVKKIIGNKKNIEINPLKSKTTPVANVKHVGKVVKPITKTNKK